MLVARAPSARGTARVSNASRSSSFVVNRSNNLSQNRSAASSSAAEVSKGPVVIGGVKFEDVHAKLSAQEQVLHYLTVPQQVLYKVNSKFFSDLPDTWHQSQVANYTKALDAVEAAASKSGAKSKITERLQSARGATRDTLEARRLISSIIDLNPSGELKDRVEDLQRAVEQWELGPAESRAAKWNEAEKLLKSRKDKTVRDLVQAAQSTPYLGSKFSAEQLKHVQATHERDQSRLFGIWGAEVKAVIDGLSPAEVRKIVVGEKEKARKDEAQELVGLAEFDGPAFPERLKFFLGQTVASRLLDKIAKYKQQNA